MQATTGTVQVATVPLGGGRILRVVRLDLDGQEPRLLLSAGFPDDVHPLAAPGALVVPASVSHELRAALEDLEGEA